MTAFAYTHPQSRMTWSGRGRQPRWIKDWLEAGNSLEEEDDEQDA